MHFFTFRTIDFSDEEMHALLAMMDSTRRGAGGILTLTDASGTTRYMVFSDHVDATMFRCDLQGKKVPFEEPGELPSELRNSPQYRTFLRLVGNS